MKHGAFATTYHASDKRKKAVKKLQKSNCAFNSWLQAVNTDKIVSFILSHIIA